MKPRSSIMACCMVLVALSGCGEGTPTASSPVIPNSTVTLQGESGNFTSIVAGHGTGTIWGINFDIPEVSMGTNNAYFHKIGNGPPEESYDITLGDVTFHLERSSGKIVAFKFRNKDYGTLEAGDKVAFDKERKVKVNGSLREPK
jgi:hypothetical protein